MSNERSLSDLIQQAAVAITMVTPEDLSDIGKLQKLMDQISDDVSQLSQLPDELKTQTTNAASLACEKISDLLRNEAADTEQAIQAVSDTIVSIQQLSEQIEKGVNPEVISVDFRVSQPEQEIQSSLQVETEVSTSLLQAQEMVIDIDDLELVTDFLTEAAEHIESVEAGLLDLENNPTDSEAINLVFRGFHTIKGMAGFLNLTNIGSLAHAAENLLDLGRKGNIQLTGRNMDVIFESVDMLKTMMSNLKDSLANNTPVPSCPGLTDFLGILKALAEGKEPMPLQPVAAVEKDTAPISAEATPVAEAQRQVPISEQPEKTPVAKVETAKTKQVVSDEKIKVSTLRLDNLVNMVGELVIAQSMVTQEVTQIVSPDHDLCRTVSHQGKIVRELQELSMMMRLVPIQGVFQKMARLVRDLSQKSGKKVTFSTEGEDTELDRIVVDQIGDPLVHMVRNSMDHGIESEDERIAAGKNPAGSVHLRAFHQSGNIVIEIEDDGRGLDKEKILKKAIDNGVVQPGQELTDQEIYKLIFHAGLSTAAKVTDVSGRGVGMDVVKRNIESLRGKIEIESELGKGSIFTIRLPLTMAIIEGQIVRVGDAHYIIPILTIESCLRPTEWQLSSVHQKAEIVTVQGNLVPMYRLYELFGQEADSRDPCQASLVVVEEDGKRGCIMVDELLGQSQVVIKSLGEGIGMVKGVSGGAIMGNGRISLIIDVPGLLELAAG